MHTCPELLLIMCFSAQLPHLILINTPSEIGGKGLLLPFYRKGNWGCPLWFSSVVSEYLRVSASHSAQPCSFDTVSRFSLFSSLTFPTIPVDSTRRHITNTADHPWLTEGCSQKSLCCFGGVSLDSLADFQGKCGTPLLHACSHSCHNSSSNQIFQGI